MPNGQPEATPVEQGGTWHENARLVLSELRRLNKWCELLSEKQTEILVAVTALKVKAGLWGLVGASIPAALAVLATILRK